MKRSRKKKPEYVCQLCGKPLEKRKGTPRFIGDGELRQSPVSPSLTNSPILGKIQT
ncbi:hypothetical protein Rctr71_064 [Virus Rctr71]|nr:hypothetical protein Rctr71_064 [Virus Rctr71]